MTREEAAEILSGVNVVDTKTYLEALGVAAAVLIESAQQATTKLDRRRLDGCDMCLYQENGEPIERMYGDIVTKYRSSTEFIIYGSCYDYRAGAILGDFKFCPFCGRPLTEEAWAELEGRISDG